MNRFMTAKRTLLRLTIWKIRKMRSKQRTNALQPVKKSGIQRNLGKFDISFSDVADNCPRQERTLKACQKVLASGTQQSGMPG